MTDDILQRLLEGALDPDSAEAQELFVEHPELREEYEKLLRLQRGLDRASALRNKILESAAAAPDEAPSAELEEFIRQRMTASEESQSPAMNAPRRGWAMALLAAGLLAMVAIWQWPADNPSPSQNPPTVMGGAFRDLQPEGTVEEYSQFDWTYDDPDRDHFRVRVYASEAGLADSPILESPPLTETTWTPTASQLQKLPASIRWEVHAMDGGGASRSSSAAQASRSP